MNKCKEKKLEEQMLNKEFREAYLIFENNPSQENQTTLSVLRERIEKLYEENVEGIIVRSRARWLEHGEKNSKYFFNLEKRNHIKKHIRKLHMRSRPFMRIFTNLSGTAGNKMNNISNLKTCQWQLCCMSSDKVARERLVWRNVPKF